MKAMTLKRRDYKCKWCGKTFQRWGVVKAEFDECDPCWELRWRIEGNEKLTEKILESIKKDRSYA